MFYFRMSQSTDSFYFPKKGERINRFYWDVAIKLVGHQLTQELILDDLKQIGNDLENILEEKTQSFSHKYFDWEETLLSFFYLL